MFSEEPLGPDVAPTYHSFLPLYFVIFAWVVGWIFGHRFTEWPIDCEPSSEDEFETDVNLLHTSLNTMRKRQASGFAGCTALIFGAIAACGVDLDIAPRGGIVICMGMFLNSVIQVAFGYRSGLMTKSMVIWWRLARVKREFVMHHDHAIEITVGHVRHDGEWPPGFETLSTSDAELCQARRACFNGGVSFIILWVVSDSIMSAIGLSRGTQGLYLVVPSLWAMACLALPIGRFLAVSLNRS
jgi:hypothetical protein